MGSRSCRGYLHVTKERLVVRAQTEHTHAPSNYYLEKIRQKFAINSDEIKNVGEGGSDEAQIKIKNRAGN